LVDLHGGQDAGITSKLPSGLVTCRKAAAVLAGRLQPPLREELGRDRETTARQAAFRYFGPPHDHV
jgi:hypothetical protein